MGGPEVRFKFKAPFGGLNHCSQEKTCPSGFVIRPVVGGPSQKPDRWHQPIPETNPARNAQAIARARPLAPPMHEAAPLLCQRDNTPAQAARAGCLCHAATAWADSASSIAILDASAFCILSSSHTGSRGSGEFELPRSRSNSMIGRSSIRKMVHSRRHRQSWGICTPRHIERRNPERCCRRWTPASDERCCKGTL